MIGSFRDTFLLLFGITLTGFLFSMTYIDAFNHVQTKMRKSSMRRVKSLTPDIMVESNNLSSSLNMSQNCECFSDVTKKYHNFCYTDPQNSSSIGRKFDCFSVSILDKLEILNSSKTILKLSSENVGKDVVFVSAFSSDHMNEALVSHQAVRKLYPDQKIIYYGLNLQDGDKTEFKKDKNLEFRDFNTSSYPLFVNNWMEYRFKPLIIAEVLKEYNNILWFDAHIVFKKPGLFSKLKNEYLERLHNQTTPLNSSIVFFIHASHSNFAVLKDEVLKYFPTKSMELLKSESKGSQLGANVFYIMKTEYTMEVMKWWVLCALDSNCMNPPGAQVGCLFKKDRFNYFANCFRFDQSIINLLLLNTFQDYHQYHSALGSTF